jgi:hypothetical protein
MSTGRGSTPRRADWLAVSGKVTDSDSAPPPQFTMKMERAKPSERLVWTQFEGAWEQGVCWGHTKFWSENLKGRHHLEDLCAGGKIQLEWIVGKWKSHDRSVGIALGYGLDDRGSRVRFPAGVGNFSLHRVKNGSEVHPTSYPMDTRVSFAGGKAAGAWSWPLTSI